MNLFEVSPYVLDAQREPRSVVYQLLYQPLMKPRPRFRFTLSFRVRTIKYAAAVIMVSGSQVAKNIQKSFAMTILRAFVSNAKKFIPYIV